MVVVVVVVWYCYYFTLSSFPFPSLSNVTSVFDPFPSACVRACVRARARARACASLCVCVHVCAFMLHALNFDNIYL